MVGCSAVNCSNRSGKGSVSFFLFPLKKPELLVKWVNALGRINFTPTQYTKICGDHFLPGDFLNRPRAYKPTLKPDAVPSIFYGSNPIKKRSISQGNDDFTAEGGLESNISVGDDDTIPQQSQQAEQTLETYSRDAESQTVPLPDYERTIKCLKAKVKILEQKVKRYEARISNLKDSFDDCNKKGLTDAEVEKFLVNKFKGVSAEIFKNQILNQGKEEKGRRYSQEIKEFALTLQYHSPKAYNYLRSIFSLPHPSSLKNWISNVNAEPGFLTNSDEDKDCNLILDGMSIRKQT